jgi:hypothetical protein
MTNNTARPEAAGRPTTREWRAGVIAGTVAGLVMAMGMMAYSLVTQGSPWINPNLIAVMWLGLEAAGGELTAATMLGFATHMATSALMGLVAIPWIYRLPAWRTMLAAFAYALGSYPLVFAVIMTWLNPLMVERAGLVPMAAAHALFGVVLGAVYLRLAPARMR